MKTKLKLYIVCLGLVMGCKKGNDLYISPNKPLEATLSALLTALEVNTFANVEGDLSRVSSILVQHSAGLDNQYVDMQNYRITEGDFGNSWSGLYSGTMKNAKILLNKAGTKSPYYAGIAKVIMAINIAIATDLWGDVPYKEAFRREEGIITPKLDTQEDIYKSIDGLLAEAVADFGMAKKDNFALPEEDDLIFKGDTNKWIKAAYTLRARYLNRISSKIANADAKILDFLSKGITTNADNMEAIHSSVGGTENQWGAFNNSREGYLGANKLFVDRLVEKNDPRMKYFLSKNKKGEYVGGDITKESISREVSSLGEFFDVSKNYPIVTFYEAKFIEAEVKQRQGINASEELNKAITASVEYVTQGKESSERVANYKIATKTDIMTEKWVALYNHCIESYNDYRRTGIPVLTPRPQKAGAELAYIPKRFPFPKETTLYNPNAKLIAMDVPVWWGM